MLSNTNLTLTHLQRNYTISNVQNIKFDLVDRTNCPADRPPAALGLAASGGSFTATTNGFFNGITSAVQATFDAVSLFFLSPPSLCSNQLN
jgi:hypothetical protein